MKSYLTKLKNSKKRAVHFLCEDFMKKFIYADNAATTKLDSDAFEMMKPYLLSEYGNASQPYSFSRASKQALKNARDIIARCINANPEEVYFTSCGTESDNWALKGTCLPSERKKLITSEIEHHAILNSAETLKKMGVEVDYLKPTNEGVITVDELSKVITPKTTLVSVMLANNEIGTIQPVKDLTEMSHKFGALFHTDAVQAVGHIKIDVKELGIDMLSASAHKFNGPKGIGFIYIKQGTTISAYLDGGSQESALRAGTENVASIVGMAYALKKNCEDLAVNKEKITKLEEYLLDLLNVCQSNNIRKNGGYNTLPGNISLSLKDQDGEALLHRLDLRGICVSAGSACDSKNTSVSHVLKAIHLDERYAKGTIRISLGKDNTEDDIRYIANELKKIINVKK